MPLYFNLTQIASAVNYAICSMMLLVVDIGKYQMKDFKCKC